MMRSGPVVGMPWGEAFIVSVPITIWCEQRCQVDSLGSVEFQFGICSLVYLPGLGRRGGPPSRDLRCICYTLSLLLSLE